jgi:toxin ParE1/3/4
VSRSGTVRRTRQAEADLISIWIYIGTDDPAAADRVLDEIDYRIQLLAQLPDMGQARPDIAKELRYFPVGRYLILYRKIKGGSKLCASFTARAAWMSCSDVRAFSAIASRHS